MSNTAFATEIWSECGLVPLTSFSASKSWGKKWGTCREVSQGHWPCTQASSYSAGLGVDARLVLMLNESLRRTQSLQCVPIYTSLKPSNSPAVGAGQVEGNVHCKEYHTLSQPQSYEASLRLCMLFILLHNLMLCSTVPFCRRHVWHPLLGKAVCAKWHAVVPCRWPNIQLSSHTNLFPVF